MLTRRELLARGTTVLLLVPIIGCTTSSDSMTTPIGPACAGTDVRSSTDASHTHTVCVLSTDLSNPPAAGVTYTTSSDGGHTHMMSLTQANLTAISGGQTITVATTNDVDPVNGTPHTHHFAISKSSSTGSGSGSGDPGGGW